MAGVIRKWLAGELRVLRWLSFDDYAHRVFASEHADWYRDPMRRVGGIVDANKVLGSQVVSFDLGGVFIAHRAVATTARGIEALRIILASEHVRKFCDDAVAALCHRLSGSADIVLQLPSPGGLLMMLGENCDDIDFDMLDDTAAALAQLVRGYAELPLSGVVVDFAQTGVAPGDELEACEVLQRAARHYRWLFAVRAADLTDLDASLAYRDLDCDLLLLPSMEAVAAAPLWQAGDNIGAGLTSDFWRGIDLPELERACLHGVVPTDVDPKTVLERIARLPC